MNEAIYILPSDLNNFCYCPRRCFLDHYLGFRRTPKQKIKRLIGSILHFIYTLIKSMILFWIAERLVKSKVYGIDGVFLVGKPDAYKVDGDTIIIEELKTSRSPKTYMHGVRVWFGDLIQVLSYAYILSHKYNASCIEIRVRYRDHVEVFEYNIAYENLLLHTIYEYLKMMDGYAPPPICHPSKCIICKYKHICYLSFFKNRKLSLSI